MSECGLINIDGSAYCEFRPSRYLPLVGGVYSLAGGLATMVCSGPMQLPIELIKYNLAKVRPSAPSHYSSFITILASVEIIRKIQVWRHEYDKKHTKAIK